MILVLSTLDPTVVEVDTRLRALGAAPVHLTEHDPVVDFGIEIDGVADRVWLRTRDGVMVHVDDVDACWYHRGALALSLSDDIPAQLRPRAQTEWLSVRAQLFAALAARPSLGAWADAGARRLTQLGRARGCGLRVPETRVVASAAALATALQELPGAITKALADGVPGYTVVASGAWCGLPMMVQAFVPKRADVRVFFLDGRSWAMALFPLSDAAAVDFRPQGLGGSRAVPYTLPGGLADAIGAFMAGEGLDIGSLDFVLTPSGELVFLEVNPSGQFWAVSSVCGYDLEGAVARALMTRAGPSASVRASIVQGGAPRSVAPSGLPSDAAPRSVARPLTGLPPTQVSR